MDKDRLNVSTGKPCESCGQDSWLVYLGYNRCACGVYLWVEKSSTNGSRYRYRQGAALPEVYRGWANVTL